MDTQKRQKRWSQIIVELILEASPKVDMSPDMRQNEDWSDFVRDVKQGLEPGGGQHMCHWRGQSDCQITNGHDASPLPKIEQMALRTIFSRIPVLTSSIPDIFWKGALFLTH